ncbi:hydantoinase/oxoprolinase family protein [Albibacillus kandeliae]|uniref:hydantoinase/oxoprolinase family protein n=1 Tax=Albibacillus kandeliae TaxID=2174228 RepID=UPI000D68E4D4|nr:hydantoinase/oxoprolinase family protein [Albibacillus kandeliae]
MSEWRLGIDIGGTFTDVIAVSPDGTNRRSAKVPSKPAEPVRAIVEAIAAVDLNWSDVGEIVHGTTIVTNDIVEQHFRPCALIATSGFADSIEIGRTSRRVLYRLDVTPKVAPLVPSDLRFEVEERLLADGSVLTELSDAEIDRVIAEIKATGVDTVAVCLLHAFQNPAHEIKLGEKLSEHFANVSLSHEISPEIREFERMSTTVLNAMMMGKIRAHLNRIDETKAENSLVHLMHSASGMATPDLIAERPLMLAMSGPAAGALATTEMARALGIQNALTFDMGGTTTDVCLIVNGRAEIAANRELGGQRIRLPMVAVDSIGAGGGSIARLVSGALEVGPRSAGATPGPACYGKGGTLPTVSDADIALGYLNPTRTLGGSVPLQPQLADKAIGALAAEMGFETRQAAVGITRVVHATMARALRRATVERGLDIRSFDLVAFGGAGPMHAVEVARICGIKTIVVPMFSSGFSALGCVDAAMSYSRQFTVNMKSKTWDQSRLDALLREETETLSRALVAAGHAAETLRVTHTAGIRYSGQSYETPIHDPAFDDLEALGAQFDAAHKAVYGYSTGETWELMTVRTEVSGPERELNNAEVPGGATTPAPVGHREVTFETGESANTPVYDRDALVVGEVLTGPLIVEDTWSTVVVPPRDTIRRDATGNLHIVVELDQ